MSVDHDIPDDILAPQDEPCNVPQLAADINRLAAVIGTMAPRRNANYDTVAGVRMEFLDCNIYEFTNAFNSPEGQALVTVKCRHCDEMIECRKIVSPFVACDPCIARVTREHKVKMYREYWEQVCPENYRDTKIDHPNFPLAIWKDVKAQDKATSSQSWFCFGPSGEGKTRVAFLLLKAALFRGQRVGVLWPEKLSTLKSRFDTKTIDRYAEYDVLLCDDTLLTACLDSALVGAVKELCDMRMRHKRPTIWTSQIGEAEVAAGKQYGDAKPADIERIAALMRRLRESCTVVSFAKPDGQSF